MRGGACAPGKHSVNCACCRRSPSARLPGNRIIASGKSNWPTVAIDVLEAEPCRAAVHPWVYRNRRGMDMFDLYRIVRRLMLRMQLRGLEQQEESLIVAREQAYARLLEIERRCTHLRSEL